MPGLAGLDQTGFEELLNRAVARARTRSAPMLVVHPRLEPAAGLADLLERAGKPGFVVEDLTDLVEFVAIDQVSIPHRGLYVIDDPLRGEEMRNWSPAEALPEILGRGGVDP